MDRKYYRRCLFSYGILSILFVLEKLIDMEKYEECKKIIDVIEEQEGLLKIKLPRKRSELKVKDVIYIYKKMGLTGGNHYENSKHYSEIMINEMGLKSIL